LDKSKQLHNYELMYILDATKSDEGIQQLTDKFKALTEANAAQYEQDLIGKRRLAYHINDMPEGYYVLIKFTSTPDFPQEITRVLGITEGVLRSLVTKVKE
jgi:small subunit ribosomal protein S6